MIPRGPLRILLAEDNAVNQLLAVRVLEELGHSVRVAADGGLAIEALAEEHFDMVFARRVANSLLFELHDAVVDNGLPPTL